MRQGFGSSRPVTHGSAVSSLRFGPFHATESTYRPDLQREIDIVEEIARRVGLQNIRRTVPSNPAKIGALTPEQRERRTLTDVLVGAGYDETFSLPLLAPVDLERSGVGARHESQAVVGGKTQEGAALVGDRLDPLDAGPGPV